MHLKEGDGYVTLCCMRRVTTKRELRAALSMSAQGGGKRRVLVPTMGALHAGHAALLRQAREIAGEDGVVVASVFLNPTQFDRAGDLASYPRTPEEDTAICEDCGVDILFMPDAQEMYRSDRSMSVEETQLSRVLCGAKRPGHFAGVCLVVSKLFNMVQPSDAVFGKKDFQQLAILRRMVRDLDFPIHLHGAPIVREKDGLAVSSRNVRLSAQQRANAPQLYAALVRGREAYLGGTPAGRVCEEMRRDLESLPEVRVDYVQMVHPDNLLDIEPQSSGELPALLAAAVFFGEVRLIDNVEIEQN